MEETQWQKKRRENAQSVDSHSKLKMLKLYHDLEMGQLVSGLRLVNSIGSLQDD